MTLRICPSCSHHFLVKEQSCPHCSNAVEAISRRRPVSVATALLLGLSLTACGDKEDTVEKDDTATPDSPAEVSDEPVDTGIVDTGGFAPEYGVEIVDEDQDGWGLGEGDCDDQEANTHPYSAENEPNAEECMTDADGDGYGSDRPANGAAAGTDCNDSDPAVSPAANEVAGDGVDSNCNGEDDT